MFGDGSSGSAPTTIYEWNSALSIESKGLVVAILYTVIKILFMHTEFWTMEMRVRWSKKYVWCWISVNGIEYLHMALGLAERR